VDVLNVPAERQFFEVQIPVANATAAEPSTAAP
jgi:hypothetical protein